MNAKLTTTKITPKALHTLRVVAAMTGERQYRLIERILQEELNRAKQREGFETSTVKTEDKS